MPSASSAKLEKQASSNQAETSDNNSAVTPIRQALVIIDHKIRNLEKRKTKLETYQTVQSSGKELTQDQKAAVAKYDEVAHSLEFAREISKQMLQIATVAEKEQKKQARKEIILKAQAETAKIREVLTIQDILFRFTNAEVREDFLNGCNGAAKLEENDLTVLEKFYNDIQAKRQTQPEDIPFIVAAQKAAEYLSMTIDGRPKQYGETTFENVRSILQSIQDCGYFDKAGKVEIIEEEIKCDEEASQMAEADVILDESVTVVGLEIRDSVSDDEVKAANPQIVAQPQPKIPLVEVPKFQSEAPAAAAVPAPTFPQSAPQPTIAAPQLVSQPQLQRPLVPPQVAAVSQAPIPPVAAVPTAPAPATPIHAGHFPPTTVRAVEQTYYKQQYIQQMRPLAEVIGSANFFFLQESELDSPDLVPSGYAPSEPQGQVPNMPPVAGTLAPQSPTGPSNLAAQPVLPQQIAMVQPGMQGKTQPQAPTNAPIPSQTFTNQSFPTIVPPPAMFPQAMQNPEIPSSQPQMQVFTGAPMPIPQLVAQPAAVSQSQPVSLPSAENHPPTIGHVDQATNPANLITGPSGANVPLPCFSNVAMATPPMGLPQATNQLKTPVDTFEAVQTSKQVAESKLHKVDETKERLTDNSNDWDANENNQKQVSTLPEEESNQWSNDVNNTSKTSNEWAGGFDNNQNESNTWNAGQNEAYSNRNNGARSGGGFSGNANRTGGGNRGTRSGPAPNNYRGRSNNSFPQQNGRNAGMYFRNNTDSNYYQNQNGSYTAGKDASGNFGGNGNNTFRLRGGPVSASNRQPSGGRISGQTNNGTSAAPPRSNSNPNRNSIGISNSNSRAGRTNGGNNANYGSSRPPNNVRQPQQDVNA